MSFRDRRPFGAADDHDRTLRMPTSSAPVADRQLGQIVRFEQMTWGGGGGGGMSTAGGRGKGVG
jgi:hypothetical protein